MEAAPDRMPGIFAANIFAWPCINSRASACDHCRRNYGHFARCAKLFRHSCVCCRGSSNVVPILVGTGDFSPFFFFFRNNIFDGRFRTNDFPVYNWISSFFFFCKFLNFIPVVRNLKKEKEEINRNFDTRCNEIRENFTFWFLLEGNVELKIIILLSDIRIYWIIGKMNMTRYD